MRNTFLIFSLLVADLCASSVAGASCFDTVPDASSSLFEAEGKNDCGCIERGISSENEIYARDPVLSGECEECAYYSDDDFSDPIYDYVYLYPYEYTYKNNEVPPSLDSKAVDSTTEGNASLTRKSFSYEADVKPMINANNRHLEEILG
jgi:hypothetical protein